MQHLPLELLHLICDALPALRDLQALAHTSQYLRAAVRTATGTKTVGLPRHQAHCAVLIHHWPQFTLEFTWPTLLECTNTNNVFFQGNLLKPLYMYKVLKRYTKYVSQATLGWVVPMPFFLFLNEYNNLNVI